MGVDPELFSEEDAKRLLSELEGRFLIVASTWASLQLKSVQSSICLYMAGGSPVWMAIETALSTIAHSQVEALSAVGLGGALVVEYRFRNLSYHAPLAVPVAIPLLQFGVYRKVLEDLVGAQVALLYYKASSNAEQLAAQLVRYTLLTAPGVLVREEVAFAVLTAAHIASDLTGRSAFNMLAPPSSPGKRRSP